MTTKPLQNILLITADQWRGECLSALGHPCVKTPHLDALIAESVVFENHYSVCAPCGPARASLLTGMYLQNHRSCRNGTPLDERHTNIALEARKAGYQPVLFGYTDTSRDPRTTDPELLKRDLYEGVLPGFKVETLLLDNSEPWIADLKAKGYDVPAALDDIYRPLGDYPDAENRGRTFPPPFYRADDSRTAFLTDQVTAYLSQQDQGWFAHVSHLRPHPPFIAPEPYNTMYAAADVPPPVRAASPDAEASAHPWLACALDDMGDWFDPWMQATMKDDSYDRDALQVRATYYGLISKVDHYIGKLIDHLKQTGAYEETLIIFTTDHGELLGDHWLFGKRGYFDQSYRIPLIIRDPRRAADSTRGQHIKAFTESVDITPTLLEWMGLAIPRQCDGRSLLGFCHGSPPADWRTEVHWEYDYRDVTDPRMEKRLGITMDQCAMNIIRDENFKYVHFNGLPPLFFDQRKDPDNFHNLANDPAYTAQMLTYTQKLLSWRMQNDERVLTGMQLTPDGVAERG
ncbi:MAG: alkaline phosphatase family protein [Rhodospirillales bacterium]|nr:alkaline phosphatase family protein [Rhodospirillales bacterium]